MPKYSSFTEHFIYKSDLGINEQIVRDISSEKKEPSWMLEIRIKALKEFEKRPIPSWGPNLSSLNLDDIYYYLKPVKKHEKKWVDVPSKIKKTFERLGVPATERKYLAGLGAQYESEMVYHRLKNEWEKKGVIFLDPETALKKYPAIFKQYFGSIIPYNDNKFAALNTAVWSGGSFIYVPKGVKVTFPLQAYFRINAEKMGQFERTLIIVDEGAHVAYIEGCTAPTYLSNSLHSAVVEIIALPGSRIRYYTIQNWSKNVFNLVTKRACAYKNSLVEWIDCNLGSGVTMKYPSVILKEEGARAEILSMAMASSKNQVQDSGGKVVHLASKTSSRIVAKSISSNGGRSSYRGMVKVKKGAKGCKSFVQCDALILDKKSRSDTYPHIDVDETDVEIGHEATISKIGDEQLFYLTSRGISQNDARNLLINGFIEPLVKVLPMEFAIEMNRLIELEMEESIG
jgi:Fe-S cluster assembly protein SufB